MTQTLLSLEIRYQNDLAILRRRARHLSGLLGFDRMDQARVATAVSEIARNALNYAGGGVAEFNISEGGSGDLLAVSISDKGPGIGELEAILAGRFQSKTGAGIGIISARRLSDTFHIDSSPRGTTVVLGKRLPAGRRFSSRDLTTLSAELRSREPLDAYDEMRKQNQELAHAMEQLRERQEELVRLNRELEDTNRGVVALYAELDEKALHLRRADELKTRFLSNMSHEFRTPLNSILALSKILLAQTDGPLSDEQRKQVTFIQGSAQDLSDLVNDLLDIAKVEAGRITLNAAETDVMDLFRSLRGMFRPLLSNAAVQLTFEEPAGIPRMFTDEGKVSQILRNFISNALKFTERGEIRVSASLAPGGHAVAFSVSDTGIGIPREHHDRIFEEFAQLEHPIQRKVKGTGLGLPLAKKLAEVLGGSISLTSDPGRGSTFTATIPVSCPGARRAVHAAPETEPDATRYPVLIVEDAPETATLYEKYLSGSAFQPIAAGSVAEARRVMARVRPVAVVLDIMTPGAFSWDFLLELKRDDSTREIPVFVASPHEEELKARAFGADDYAMKPVDPGWLLGRLRHIVERTTADKLLIVDDDEIWRYVVRQSLSGSRYELVEAATGEAGLKAAREQQPAAILLDLVMPGLSGFDVLKALRAQAETRQIPVVVVTSATLSDEERQRLSGASAVISKRSSPGQETIAVLKSALASAITTPAP